MKEERWKEFVEEQKAYKEKTLIPIIEFLKEREEGLTFYKAKKILSDTIDFLKEISERREI